MKTPSAVKIKKMPSRFKHQVPKYKITRSDACINCGTCANHAHTEFMRNGKGKTR